MTSPPPGTCMSFIYWLCHHLSQHSMVSPWVKETRWLSLRAHWQPVRNESPFYLKLKELLWGYRQSLESPFDFNCPRLRHLQDPGSAHSAPAPICQVSESLCYNFLHEIEGTTLKRWVIFLIPQNDGKIELGNDAQETDPVRVSGMEGAC